MFDIPTHMQFESCLSAFTAFLTASTTSRPQLFESGWQDDGRAVLNDHLLERLEERDGSRLHAHDLFHQFREHRLQKSCRLLRATLMQTRTADLHLTKLSRLGQLIQACLGGMQMPKEQNLGKIGSCEFALTFHKAGFSCQYIGSLFQDVLQYALKL